MTLLFSKNLLRKLNFNEDNIVCGEVYNRRGRSG